MQKVQHTELTEFSGFSLFFSAILVLQLQIVKFLYICSTLYCPLPTRTSSWKHFRKSRGILGLVKVSGNVFMYSRILFVKLSALNENNEQIPK
jgi:hypothetical protein